MIYLDNAATSYPKPREVVSEIIKSFKIYGANPGRGSHLMSNKTAEATFRTRESLARLLNIDEPERIVFTQNATYALNLAIKTSIVEPCHIITSDIEHNSVIRPLLAVAREIGCKIDYFDSSITPELSIPPLVRDDTKFIVSTLASNLTGAYISLDSLSGVAKKYGLELIVDASQIIGHRNIDLSNSPCNILCAPGHKGLLGPMGSGFAVILDDKKRRTIIEGGSGNQSMKEEMPELYPERYEAGTLSVPAILGLGAGVRFLMNFGLDRVEEKINALTDKMRTALDIRGVEIIGCNGGICSFNLKDMNSSFVAEELSNRSIAVRAGLHCAPLAHTKYGTLGKGAVRASVSIFNSDKDILNLRRCISEILR